MRLTTIEAPKDTLADAINQFIQFKTAQQVSPRTLRDYHFYLNEFLASSSNSLEYHVLMKDVLEYLSNVPDTSPARFNHRYQNLSALFNWAIRQDYITKNPITAQGIHKKRDDGNIKPATIEDIKLLLDSFNQSSFAGLRNYIITLVMIDTGIRTSELIRLRDIDFDANAKQITISKHISKTRRNRTVYLTSGTAKLLSKLIKIKPEGFSEFIFPTREGNQLTTEGLDREFRRQCDKIGVKITPYQFRHTFATYFVQSGGDIFTLQDIMGHADIRMTRRYTELDNATKQRSHEKHTPLNMLQGTSRLVKI